MKVHKTFIPYEDTSLVYRTVHYNRSLLQFYLIN